MENIYKKNFLTNVIVKVDFPNPLTVHESLPASLSKTILNFFPVSEPKKLQGQTFTFDGTKIQVEGEERTTEWNYFGHNRDKHLILSSKFMTISLKNYETFEPLESEFITIIEKLYETYPDLQINKLGLRYINEISLLDQTDPLIWNDYLNDNLITLFDVAEDKTKIAKCFNDIIFNLEDFIVYFKYGMHNPDFPTPIKKKIFILDYDAQVTTLQDLSDVNENLTRFHNEIKSLFESHIKEDLRVIMRG